MVEQRKRIYRSTSNKVLAGVCGGIGEYFNVDPTVVRIAWILLSILPLIPGIIIYILAWFIIPRRPAGESAQPATGRSVTAAGFLGYFFIGVGSLVLLANLDLFDWGEWWEFSWEYLLPLLLIAIGVFFVARPAHPVEDTPPGTKTKAGAKRSEPAELRRSVSDRKIGGVCAGLGSYLGVDPSIVRIAFVFFSLWPFGLGVVVYLIMLLLVPNEEVRVANQT